MNKIDFCWILECALLSFDGITLDKMVKYHGVDYYIAQAGTQLCDIIKSLETPQKSISVSAQKEEEALRDIELNNSGLKLTNTNSK